MRRILARMGAVVVLALILLALGLYLDHLDHRCPGDAVRVTWADGQRACLSRVVPSTRS